tara:strand:+ start:1499 stop:1681 length:183 start_codon:yes stop_codon:yes gene_type:complete
MNISQEYVGALAIIVVSILKTFHIEIGNDVITALLTGVIGIWIAIRRYQKGDITPLGKKV